MKFISKNSNLRIVIEPGYSREQATGRPAKPGVYVKFQNGIVNVVDEELIKKMYTHPGFNKDYIAVEENSSVDPYRLTRVDVEPQHQIAEIKYGHVENVQSSPKKVVLSKEMEELIEKKSEERAKILAVEILKSLKSQSDVLQKEEKPKVSKRGRAKSVKVEEEKQSEEEKPIEE